MTFTFHKSFSRFMDAPGNQSILIHEWNWHSQLNAYSYSQVMSIKIVIMFIVINKLCSLKMLSFDSHSQSYVNWKCHCNCWFSNWICDFLFYFDLFVCDVWLVRHSWTILDSVDICSWFFGTKFLWFSCNKRLLFATNNDHCTMWDGWSKT